MNYLQHNLSFLPQVKADKQPFYKEFCEYCDARNIQFRVISVKRTYQQQCLLFSQGRTINDIVKNSFYGGFKMNQQQMKDMLAIFDKKLNRAGPVVTYTLSSEHLTGSAFDVHLINTTHTELSLIAIKWDITHPYSQDQAHYSLTNARAKPQEMTPVELQAKNFFGVYKDLAGVPKERFLIRIMKHLDLYNAFKKYL